MKGVGEVVDENKNDALFMTWPFSLGAFSCPH
jgi:hypothetical protein